MVAFNPNNASGEPTNFTGRSQGLPANRAGEILLEGVGGVVEGAAKAKDFQIQQNIRQDVTDIWQGTNAGFGLDEDAGFNTVANKNLVPDEFKDTGENFRNRLGRIHEARKQGALSETHYYSMLAYSMKNLKSKYPGYHDIIDNIYGEVTGERPANQVRNQLWAEQEALAKDAQDSASALDKRLWETREWWGQPGSPYQDFLTNPEKYAGREKEILQYGMQRQAEDQKNKADITRINLAQEQGNLTKENAQQVYTEQVNYIVTSTMRDIMKSDQGASIVDRIIEAGKTGNITPEDLQQIKLEFNYLKTNMQTKMMELRRGPNGSAFNVISPDTIGKIESDAFATLNHIEQMIDGGNFDLAGLAARRLAMERTRDAESLRRIPEIRTVEAATSVNPALGQEVIRNMNAIGRDLGQETRDLGTQYILEAAYGVSSMYKILRDIDADKGVGDLEKSKIATNVVNQIGNVFRSNEFTDKEAIDFVKQNFMGQEPDMGKVFDFIGDDNESKLKIYRALTEPSIIDRLAKVQDGGISAKAYASWVFKAFDDVPQVNTALNNLAAMSKGQTMAVGSGMPEITVSYDTTTNRLVAIPNTATTQQSDTQAKLRGQSTFGEVLAAKYQKDLDKVNLVLGNMKYVLDTAGVNADEYIMSMLELKGVDLSAIAGQPGGSQDGTSPLSEKGDVLPPNFGFVDQINKVLEGNRNESSFTDGALEDISFNWTEQQQNEAAASGNYAGLLNFVGGIEAPKGYNQVYGKNNFLPRDNMTLDEVLNFQRDMVRGGSPSSAVGRYQFLRKTLAGLKEELGLTGSEEFTPELQDKLASRLVERRGGKDFLEGRITRDQFLKNLSMEWASLPKDASGRSYYAGDGLNKALTSHGEAMQVLEDLAAGGQPKATDARALGYGNIPTYDSRGENQIDKFLQWNDNPLQNSEKLLASVDPNLGSVVRRAMEISGRKFVVGSGIRDPELQKKAVAWGWSKTEDSDHLHGGAVDLWALDDNGQVSFDPQYYAEISGAMKLAAKELGYEVDWGGDWKSFKDIPHFALK